MVAVLKAVNLALRGLMELGIVIALGYWGYRIGRSGFQRIVLTLGAPAVILSAWALFDFRHVVQTPEPYRLLQELVLSGLAAFAWYASGQRRLGITLGLVSIVHHALVYLLGGRLLK